jgi:hypothetical protein
MNSFEIAGIVIIRNSALKFSQNYSSKRVGVDHQMGDSSTTRQTLLGTDEKIKTRIDGFGWQSPNLAGETFTQPVLLKCVKPRVVNSSTVAVTLPAARRTDTGYTPTGYAIVAGEEVATTINDITANVATLIAVTGATSYHVQYVPEITVFATYVETYSSDDDTYTWSLDCVET